MKVTERNLIKAGWTLNRDCYEKLNRKRDVLIQVIFDEGIYDVRIYRRVDSPNTGLGEWLISLPTPVVKNIKDLQDLARLYLEA